jgi:hypothetical protein
MRPRSKFRVGHRDFTQQGMSVHDAHACTPWRRKEEVTNHTTKNAKQSRRCSRGWRAAKPFPDKETGPSKKRGLPGDHLEPEPPQSPHGQPQHGHGVSAISSSHMGMGNTHMDSHRELPQSCASPPSCLDEFLFTGPFVIEEKALTGWVLI